VVTTFLVGLDRGFLNAEGELAWGDIGIGRLADEPRVQTEFLAAPAGYPVRELTPEHVRRYQGLILGGTAVTRRSLADGAEGLVVVCRAGVGYDRIDVAALTEHDVALCTTPAASKHAVASASFAYMIALAKRMLDKDRLVRSGRWDLGGAYCGNELWRKTLGVVGFGNTGSELARLVGPFEMQVLCADPFLTAERARELGGELVPLDELLRRSDFVCVHALLTEQTRRLIGERELGLMKPTAYFVNCARGPIVDETALIRALQGQRIAGAGLDVFEEEPLRPDSPLIGLDNVMLSPHTMAHTLELSIWMGEINTRQLIAAAHGHIPESIVNREAVERAGFQAKLARWRFEG
jgi:phosphoglycerate dehydrogenase-like enzyme